MFLRRSLILITIFLTACAASVPAATATDTPTPTPSETPTPSDTPSPSIPPTYSILRGKVIMDGRLSCRFGPGADYLFKFSFGSRASVEILGRMEYSNWVLVRAVGGTNRCWICSGV